MSQYNDQRPAGAGRSRAKGSAKGKKTGGSRGTSSRSTSSRAASSRTSSGRSSASYSRSTYSSGGRKKSPGHRGGSDRNFFRIAVGGVLLIAAIACIVFLMKNMKINPADSESETETTTIEETELQKEVTVDGLNITGMSREEAREEILKEFPWAMKVTWQDDTYEVADLMAGKVDAVLQEIYSGEPKESYSLDTSGLEEAAKAEAANAAARWDKKAKNGSISSYDAGSDKFVFTGAEQGQAVDQEKLAADIVAALGRKEFDAVIAAAVNPVDPEFSESTAKEKYKTLSSFTTNTTANSNRNTNVKLAAQAINGTVLQPGEEFSFNQTVGQRTEAKGYKGAAAYNNGEVVQEIGGGVCQVSSTLYNAVLKAGLKSTVRRSHTYEPSYVTPGTDATVSWGGPDYKFVNNSSAAIGIRASYSNQTVTVSIYGIPVLEDGVKYSLKSTKIKDMDPPAPTYEEDPTLEPGVEKTASSGSRGSYWETRLVITKNGEVVSQEVDHTVTYKGHAPVIRRNTSGTVAETQPSESESAAETVIAPEGAGDGYPGGSGSDTGSGTSAGPGGSSSGNSSSGPAAGSGSGTVSGPGGGPSSAAQPSPAPETQPAPAQPAPSTQPASTPETQPAPAPGSSDAPQMIAPMPGV